MDADRALAGDRRQLAERRVLELRGGPLLAREKRDPLQVAQRVQLIGIEPLRGEPPAVPRTARSRPFALAAQLDELQRREPLAVERLGLRVPVGTQARQAADYTCGLPSIVATG